jgi:hypothetical protein
MSRIDLLEVTESRALDALAKGTGIWKEIEREGIVVFGANLASLKARRRRVARA